MLKRRPHQFHILIKTQPQKLQFRRKTTVFRLTQTRMLISEKSKIWEMYFGDIWTVGKCTSAKTAVISRTDFKWGRWKSWILYSGLWTVSTQPIFPKTRRQKIVIDTRKCCEILKFCCRQERILQLLTSIWQGLTKKQALLAIRFTILDLVQNWTKRVSYHGSFRFWVNGQVSCYGYFGF